jgi:hypothetical protein
MGDPPLGVLGSWGTEVTGSGSGAGAGAGAGAGSGSDAGSGLDAGSGSLGLSTGCSFCSSTEGRGGRGFSSAGGDVEA